MHKRFDHKEIEEKWQTQWQADKIYQTQNDSNKPKAFVLDMFPYPSGEGLHVGHPKGYIATDIYSRFKRMTGHNVLHPMGWDAFGLPAENYAIKNKVHPSVAVNKNVARFKQQLEVLGFDYDWSREINTTDPNFYKWTQWIFIQLFKKGLAYESYEPINWCPGCQTGLANEDLEPDGTCERCGAVVEQRPMRQWVLKIREYADRMLEDLDTLEWPEHIKEAQRNWIGRSKGAEIDFKLSVGEKVTVFTTRPDTLFGATYIVLAPEHELVQKYKKQITNWSEVETYIQDTKSKKEMDRLDDTKEKTGVKLEGVIATNPANNAEIPVYIADYVLASYGTGAIMAVPAHDQRDYEFARKNDIKVIRVWYGILDESAAYELANQRSEESEYSAGVDDKNFDIEEYRTSIEKRLNDKWDEDLKSGAILGLVLGGGKHKTIDPHPLFSSFCLKNSEEFDGRDLKEAGKAIVKKVNGRMATTYKIKDWVFSRQRYWGEPIPIVHCEKCGAVPVPEAELPLVLPEVEHYEPAGDGQSPLATITDWVNTKCPKCGGKGKRETNTMPQWAGSSWYYLRYMDPQNDKELVSKENEKYWSPIDVYVGGDHAVRHLIYARFWHKFLYDIGVVSTIEPFQRLEFLGFILAEDDRKMSKRWGNVINPDDVVKLVGADTLRIYEMFMGPFENTIAWSQDGLAGARRFLERVNGLDAHIVETESKDVTTQLHKTIQKVGEDIEGFKFNTAVSAMMIFINQAEKAGLTKESYLSFLRLLSPFAPHLTEDLWHALGYQDSIHLTDWPAFDTALTQDETVTIGVQINGKMRGQITVSPHATEAEVLGVTKQNPNLLDKIAGREIKKVIYVPGRILNLLIPD